MKQIIGNYTFTPGPAGAGSVTLNDFAALAAERVILVLNVTRGTVLYNATSSAGPFPGLTVAGNALTFAADSSAGGALPTDSLLIAYDVQTNDPAGADYQAATRVDTERLTWRRNFNGAALDTTKLWSLPVGQGAGQGITLTAGQLVLTSGTTANSTTIVRSRQGFNLPMRAQFCITTPAKVANANIYLEIVNAAGDTYVGWLLQGATDTVTQARAEFANKGNVTPPGGSPTTAFTIGNLTSGLILELDARVDGVEWIDRVPDALATGTGRLTKHRTILDADETYFVQLRMVNLATAPASSATWNVDFVSVEDTTRTAVDVFGGRGNSIANRGVPIVSAGGSMTLNASGNRQTTGAGGIWWDESSTALAAAGTVTSTARDLAAGATNVAFSTSTYGREVRYSALADVAGTLYLEVSRDNVTWRRVKSVTLTQAAGSGVSFYGEIVHLPTTRYVRAVFVNGATVQTYFLLQCFALAA